ncbi:phage major capsid protein [Limimaricola litoreus]|uniref:Phage major capsid protein n=1 Tax=Limimaricola litoreus TaxID=2955316 RepID=A0A9X2FMT1_9RHOB|nr:phage major capsid protein [Limimaricola litoreus]MCP1167902.1 phage major capsid protein [Limimaricola litoreus]
MRDDDELGREIGGLMDELGRFSAEIRTKLKAQDDRMTRLDRKTALAARPALEAKAEAQPHRAAFGAYLRTGEDDGLRGLGLEGKAMSSTVAADGGYLVDPQTADRVRGVLGATASLRAIASVVAVDAGSYDVLIDHAEPGAGWADETTARSETSTPKIDRITIPLHELSALPKTSQRLLDDSAFDIEGWLAGRIADTFARSEAAAFVSGDGVDKPTGILSYPQVDDDGWSWGSLGYVATGTDGGFDAASPADAVIDLVYRLGAPYRAGASFVMNSRTAGALRKLKDADGRFLWSDGLSAGEPARLLGYPVLIAEDMPDIATDACALAFGNFEAGYTIAERPDLRVLRDPFSAKPHVIFYATKRVGGAVSDFAAIKLLKFGIA